MAFLIILWKYWDETYSHSLSRLNRASLYVFFKESSLQRVAYWLQTDAAAEYCAVNNALLRDRMHSVV